MSAGDFEALVPAEGWLARWMEYGRSTVMAPPEFVLAAGLGALSTAVGATMWFRLGAKRWTPNLWLLLLAPAGARKSTPASLASEAIVEAMGAAWILPRRFSLEGFARELSEHPDGFWDAGEIAGFLRLAGRDYMAGARQELCDIWDGRTVSLGRARKKDSIEPFRASMSAIATGRAADFNDSAGIEDFSSGFLSRWLVMTAATPGPYRGLLGVDGRVSVEDDQGWKDLTDHLGILAGKLRGGPARAVEMDKRAIKLWESLDKEWIVEPLDGEMSGWGARRGLQALKLAVLHAVAARGMAVVDAEDMAWGLEMVEWSFACARDLAAGEIGLDREQRRRKMILDRGRALANGGAAVNARDWMRAVWRHLRDAGEFNRLLEMWEQAGVIHIQKESLRGGGIPRRMVKWDTDER